MKLEYPYKLEPQESGGFVVQFLDIEEAFTEGATPEECAFNAAEVLTGILEQRLADGAEIPLPGKHPRRPAASPSAAVQTAILMRVTRQEEGKAWQIWQGTSAPLGPPYNVWKSPTPIPRSSSWNALPRHWASAWCSGSRAREPA